jgi:hypothetical protein
MYENSTSYRIELKIGTNLIKIGTILQRVIYIGKFFGHLLEK